MILPSQHASEGWLDLTKKLTMAELITAIASIATTVSTILTFLLLKETQRTLNLSAKVADRDNRRLEAEIVNLIYRNFRDTYVSMLNDKGSIKALIQAHGKKPDDIKISMHASFLINNVHEMYNLYTNGFVNEEIWENFYIDIEDFFSFPFIKVRWDEIKTYYPKTFQNFVENFMLNQSNNKSNQ